MNAHTKMHTETHTRKHTHRNTHTEKHTHRNTQTQIRAHTSTHKHSGREEAAVSGVTVAVVDDDGVSVCQSLVSLAGQL